MSVSTIAPTNPAHPLEPVRATVMDAAQSAALATLGGDQAATWYPASWLTDPRGPAMSHLLDGTAKRWGLGRHAAAALAFKGYAWAATLPVVAGWAQHQRVPLLESSRLRIGVAEHLPYVRFDLAGARLAARPGDPAASHPRSVIANEDDELMAHVRASLLDQHLAEVVEVLHEASRVGARLLWGSVAEAIAASAILLRQPTGAVRQLLARLGSPIADLVEIHDGGTGPSIRRRSCCLWFTGEAGRGEYCSTCCVT